MKNHMKIWKPKSLRWQLFTSFFLILMVLLVLMEVYQYINLKHYLSNSKVQILQSRLHNVDKNTLDSMKTPENVNKNASNLVEKLIDVNITASVINEKGNVIARSYKTHDIVNQDENDKHRDLDDPNSITFIPKLQQTAYMKLLNQNGNLEGSYSFIKDNKNNLQIVIWRKIGDINSPSGLIQLSISAQDVNNTLDRQLSIYIGASILILIIGIILARTIFNGTLKPLYNMTNTVEQINADQLDKRLPIDNGQLEIDRLSYSFNNMLQRIENSFKEEQHIKEKMRQFVSDASHELRTPLTSIHGFAEVLLMGSAKNEEQLNLALNSILSESERLSKLVSDLLMLTKLDKQIEVEKATEDISLIIEEILPQLKILAKKRKIELHLEHGLLINANRNQMKQVILNLVQNSIKYTDEENGVIAISTSSVKDIANKIIAIKVSDNGTGVPDEHINEIFDRFFRSESHRSRKYGGYGLGLSIVKSIVEAHNGKIEVNSKFGKGTTFTIYFNEVTI